MPSPAKSPKDPISVEPTLEEALGRLESIVEAIEQTPPPLEELIDRYEEGMKLLAACRARLDAAGQRIEMITRNSRGEVVLEPLIEQ